MPDFILTSTRIMADGRTVRLQFEAGVAVGQTAIDRLRDVGFMDYMPAQEAGQVVTVNGQAAEVIGVQCEDWNMPLPWIDPPQSGGEIAAGEYFFLVAIHDKDGRELKVSPPIFGNSDNTGERGHMLPSGSKITLNWRVSPPDGGYARIYTAQAKPMLDNLRVVAQVFGNHQSVTLGTLAGVPSGATFKRQSVCLTVTCLLAKPVRLGDNATVVAPSGLCADKQGNATQAATVTATNESVVDVDGKLATYRMTFADTVCVSSSQGNDAAGSGTLASPFKTIGKAVKALVPKTNVCVLLLAGDVFPFEPWLIATPGLSADKPSLYESYWNPSYGDDPRVKYEGEPGAKPILLGDTSTAPDPNGERVWFRQFDPATGQVGDAPFQYFSGLEFRGDATRGALAPIWPAGSPQDHIVLIDCDFSNVQLQPSYGSAMKLAPIGCALINCSIKDVHANVASPAHVQGMFIAHCGDFLISGSEFDHNGWRYDGTEPKPDDNTMFSHNVYCSSMARQVIVVDSFFGNGGHSGLQMRGGGVCAYTEFDSNVSGFSAMDTHSLYLCKFAHQGLYNHIVSQAPSWDPEAVHDNNHVLNQQGFDQTREIVANYDGINCFHHDSGGQYVASRIVVRHETSDNGGAISLGNMLPTHHLIVSHCLLENTGKDYKGNSFRNVCLKPGNTNKPVIEWDQNCYTFTGSNDSYVWGAKLADTLSGWQSMQELDTHSIELPAPATPPPIADAGGYYGATDYRKPAPTPTPEPVPPTPPTPQPLPPIAFEPLVRYARAQIAAAEQLLADLGAN
jgi:hypothetical protein